MKVAIPKKDETKMAYNVPLLSLVPDPKLYQLDKGRSMEFTLRTVPADANSPKYKATIRILHGDESVRAILLWKKELNTVLNGLNATTIAQKVSIALTVMRGTPSTLFETRLERLKMMAMQAAVDAAADAAARNAARGRGLDHYAHIDHFNLAINWVVQNLVPHKALAKIKRYLRRECRKPDGMLVRTFFQYLVCINTEELEQLPPFNPNQILGGDEILDILLYAVPKSWVREMDRQGKDPYALPMADVVTFFEQIEHAEKDGGYKMVTKNSSTNNTNNNGNGNQKKSGNKNNGGGQKYCALHGKGNHTTDECHHVKTQVKKMKSSNDNNSGGNGYSSGSKNKSWSKKANDGKFKAKKELNAMNKEIKRLKQEVNSLNKKRKSSKNDDDSSGDEEEMNAIEQELNALDMNGFDIEDLKASMKANGDDEASC